MVRIVRANMVGITGQGSCWDAAEFRLVDYRGRRPPQAGTDEWGVTWAPLPGQEDRRGMEAPGPRVAPAEDEIARSYPVGRPASTASEVAALPFPDGRDPAPFAGLLGPYATQGILPSPPAGGFRGKSRTAGEGVCEGVIPAAGRHPLGPLDRLCALLGPEQALLALIEEPEAARAALDRIADYHVAIAANYLVAGCTAGWLADEYAGANGPLLRPALWREMVLPGLRRIIAVYKDAGACVFFHMCGRAEAFVPDLLAAGVDAFNLERGVGVTIVGVTEVVCRN